ncbi:MAG: histidinol-phosphate transaminase [Actinobacteria bacterium]|nr:histidinol-phosphate transaminase [Actinomycetota bacterium]
MALRFIPALAGIVPYQPGLPIEMVKRRFGLEDVVKLASNEYPLPPFPEVKEAVIAAIDQLQRYPDGHSTDLREALAARFDLSPGQVAVGCGSCELLYLLADALLEKGDEVVFADPSFVVYGDICRLHEARAVAVPLVDFTHDLEAMAAAITPRTKMVFVCNPNNPTGTYASAADIARLVEAVPDDVLVVVDEAYNEFVTAPDSQDVLQLQKAHDNVIILRTFSKIYGLCGLRTGFGLCSPELKVAIDKVRQPFNVNLLGQVAAVEALKHQDQVVRRRELNAELRDYMVDRLAARGRATVPSQANFMLVDTRDLSHPHDRVCGVLLSLGAIVRDGNALGCPGLARVSVGTQAEIEFFLSKLASLEVGATGDVEGRTS